MSEIQGLAPPDILPEKAIPLPTPSTPSARVPSLQTLRSWAPLYLHKTDLTLDRLHTILSKPSGSDTFLLIICYTSLLSSSILSSISLHRLHRSATQLVHKITALPPNTTIIIDTTTIPSSRLLVTAKRLKALSELISDFRIFARLWGLLGIYKWGKRTLENPPEDVVVKRIVYAQVIVNIFFQYLENGAYLSSKGVLGWSKEKQDKAWMWSSRFWMAHVGLDFVRLYRMWLLRKRRGTEEERRVDGPKGDVTTDRGEQEWRAAWMKEALVNAAWFPLTLHWGLEDGLVNEFWVGVLGSVAGVVGWGTLWRKSGEM